MQRIPNDCEVCHSPIKEGELGEPAWLCTNPNCERSQLDWPLIPYRKKLDPLYKRLEELSSTKLSDGTKLIISLHEGRYIGDGSGDIQTGQNKIEFYLDGEQINFSVEDSTQFQEITGHLMEMLSVRKRIGEILMS